MRFPSRTGRMSATLLAAFALATAGGHSVAAQTRQSTTDSLIYDLKNPDAPRRQSATRDLGIAKFLPAIPALLPLASDPDASVRRELELTLEAMNDIRVLPGLVQLSADPEAAGDRTDRGARQAGEPDRRLVG
jgi:HEAT repeat protein